MGNMKNVYALVGSGILLITILVLVFIPFSSVKIPGSYSDFQGKSDLAMELNSEKQKAILDVENKNATVAQKENENEKVTEAASKSKELFNELLATQKRAGDWSYHVPSLLIRLEDAADKRKVKVAMDYGTFKEEGTFVSDSNQGLKVVELDVKVYGKYGDVQSYIKAIEEISFVSVEDLVLKRVSNGKLTGNYKLNVYYLDKE